jgi:hypothetical protein
MHFSDIGHTAIKTGTKLSRSSRLHSTRTRENAARKNTTRTSGSASFPSIAVVEINPKQMWEKNDMRTSIHKRREILARKAPVMACGLRASNKMNFSDFDNISKHIRE